MSKPRVLFLDDMEQRHSTFAYLYSDVVDIKHVYNYDDCTKALEEEYFSQIYLDHDLQDFNEPLEKTGLDVVRWIIENRRPEETAEIIVHSLNPEGARAMVMELNQAGFEAMKYPFINLIAKIY